MSLPMTELPSIRKFMFDHSFDQSAVAVRASERKPVTLKPEQVDALKKESYDQGFAAGQKAGTDEQTNQTNALLTRLDERLANMAGAIHTLRQEYEQKAHQIAMAIARKLMPDFVAKSGLQEIETMLTAAIGEMAHEPRLVVRVNEAQFDTLNTKVQDIAAQKAYAGKVVVLADPQIPAGDCRVEWADGGMERNTAATLADIEQVVAPTDPTNVNTEEPSHG
jgi:flagellar assembly protein FliH